ncbi:hypothetical protein E2542_SST01493 [Spatholobus suberectus]|nr:hypothetical protein E2542_SST01493 [Spatholobus suberectus]
MLLPLIPSTSHIQGTGVIALPSRSQEAMSEAKVEDMKKEEEFLDDSPNNEIDSEKFNIGISDKGIYKTELSKYQEK